MTAATTSRDPIWRALAIVLALVLVLTVWLTFNNGGQSATETAAADTADVTLGEFEISPAEVTVAAGTPVTLRVRNEGTIDHDLEVEGLGGTALIASGGTEALQLGALEPGEYALRCTVAGHEGAGMTGVLRVVEDDPAAAQVASDTGTDHSAMTPEEMAAMHEQGVADFPVETEGQGNQPLEPEIADDGTKVFELTAEEIEWETEPGTMMEALAYNGQVPGPQLRVELGDSVRVILNNELSDPTALHFHGLLLPNDMDGVPGLNQPSILPGESFTYEFTLRNSGSHMYHSHFDSATQVTKGLLGAFIVDDPADPQVDLDYTMILNDGPLGFTLNGKGFPATEPLAVKLGDTIRVRYMNEGLQIHPMHLHGIPQQMVARDGYPLDQPYTVDTVTVAPGERIDVLIEATEPGPWAFHCHVLNHAEGADGMFGMVTALIVEE